LIKDLRENKAMKILETKVRRYLPLYGNCPQTTFLVLREQFELDGGPILSALSTFPGIARRGETCGAVNGYLVRERYIDALRKAGLSDQSAMLMVYQWLG
jgi:hypothetical protein